MIGLTPREVVGEERPLGVVQQGKREPEIVLVLRASQFRLEGEHDLGIEVANAVALPGDLGEGCVELRVAPVHPPPVAIGVEQHIGAPGCERVRADPGLVRAFVRLVRRLPQRAEHPGTRRPDMEPAGDRADEPRQVAAEDRDVDVVVLARHAVERLGRQSAGDPPLDAERVEQRSRLVKGERAHRAVPPLELEVPPGRLPRDGGSFVARVRLHADEASPAVRCPVRN